MKVESEIKKWGNSLALRVTGIMADIPNFRGRKGVRALSPGRCTDVPGEHSQHGP